MSKRKSIRLKPDERESLESLYVAYRIPTDQWIRRRPDMLTEFVSKFNKLVGRGFLQGEVLHFMYTQRKNGCWPTFDGQHRKLPPLADDVLSSEEWEILRQEYESLAVGSDNFVFDDALRLHIEEVFAKRAGRIVLGAVLFSAIMKKRKRRLWAKVGTKTKGFSDVDAVVAKYS